MPWSLSNIKSIGAIGVSPHLEIDGDNIGEKYQLYYSSTERNGLAIDGMSTNLELTQQGVLSSIQDLTIVTTNQGIRRAYYIDLDEIYTALISDDGLTLAIGAPLNDGNGTDSGHVRIFENINNSWTQIGSDIDGEAAGDQY